MPLLSRSKARSAMGSTTNLSRTHTIHHHAPAAQALQTNAMIRRHRQLTQTTSLPGSPTEDKGEGGKGKIRAVQD